MISSAESCASFDRTMGGIIEIYTYDIRQHNKNQTQNYYS